MERLVRLGPALAVANDLAPLVARGRELVDRDGARLPVEVDARGRTRIFDAFPRDWRGSMAALREAGVDSFMVGERAGALR